MHFTLSFVLLFGAVASTLASNCFSGNGNVTTVNPSCTGSATLEVKKQELKVEFKWKGAFDGHLKQNFTFNFGGCSIIAKLQGANKPQFDIKGDVYNLPLTFIVQPNAVSVVQPHDEKTLIKCTSSFEKIPDSSAFKINVAYTADTAVNFQKLNVTFHGTIYVDEPNDDVYKKSWFWIGTGLICSLIILGVIVTIVICSVKKGSKKWKWPTARYSQKQLKQLMSQFPPVEAANYQVHTQHAQNFIQNHPLNPEQCMALKNEEKIWYAKNFNKDNDAETALNAYRTWFLLNLLVIVLGEHSEVSPP